jgi:hypothetical protein
MEGFRKLHNNTVPKKHDSQNKTPLNITPLTHVSNGLYIECPPRVGRDADMPYCNLSETIYNKGLQQSGNRGNDLFAATYDDKIRAVMQMTNYRAYLKGKHVGPVRQRKN